MKRLLFLSSFFLLCQIVVLAQGENNKWIFTTKNYALPRMINFGNTTPHVEFLQELYHTRSRTTLVCWPSGQTRFFIRIGETNWLPYAPIQPNAFTASGEPISNSDFKATPNMHPVVIPHPGNSDQYYIFYGYSQGLAYSLLDMSLNNGFGGIVTGQKDIIIAPYGTVEPYLMTPVLGCNGVWLVIRSRVANQYLSYAVTSTGIDTNAVVSTSGLLEPLDYSFIRSGFLRAAPNGSMLALSGYRGIELYDFEKCSGKVKNARTLDTTGTPTYTSISPAILGSGQFARFHGICFSPDNSKLYVTWNKNGQFAVLPGRLYQYDVSLPDLADMTASKTLILENQPSILPEISGPCIVVVTNPLGEIKRGPNGKIYVDNGSESCMFLSNLPPGYNPGPAFHCINQPDLPGIACDLSLNALLTNTDSFSQTWGSFDRYNGEDFTNLPQDVIIAPPPLDTLSGESFYLEVCFKDSLLLLANEAGKCYRWDDGTTKQERTVGKTGTYYVSYFRDCSYTTDTYHVQFVKLPTIGESEKSCPGMTIGKLTAKVDSTNTYPLNYTWRSMDGSILRYSHSMNGDILTGLSSGDYTVQVSTGSGCDTIIPHSVTDMPKPTVGAMPSDTTIRYGDSMLLKATGAELYVWWPTAWLDTATKANPVAKPLEPVTFSVMGLNEFGCRDTGYVRVNIDYTMPDMVPNAFSPNGDGLNDIFSVQGIAYQKVSRFSVFNRLGQQVFTTQDARQGWDGTFNGKECDAGVYYYLIQLSYPDPKAREKILRGDVTLIR